MPELKDNITIYSLEEVALSIKKTLAKRYGSSFWVKAEMNKLNYYAASGHCYPDLVEKKEGKIIAQLRASLWKSDYQLIQARFLHVLKEPLKDGIRILFSARVSFDPVHGLSLRILDIDPSYSLGELEIEKQATISRLKEEGLYFRNKSLAWPLLPKRIAIISVDTSKGYKDFLEKTGSSKYKIFHMLFPSVLQGDRAVNEILIQLKRIRKVAHHFDAVAIIRGGGGDVGLSCYNNYELCKSICMFPLPVLTGIGHATNETVSEMVSHKNCLTPTDLADFLMQQFNNMALPLEQMVQTISEKAKQLFKDNNLQLEHQAKYFQSGVHRNILLNKNALGSCVKTISFESRHMLHKERSLLKQNNTELQKSSSFYFKKTLPLLENLRQKMYSAARNMVSSQSKDLNFLVQRVEAMDPVNVLKRGYTITKVNGNLVQSVNDVKPGDILSTITKDGSITSIADQHKNNL